MLHNPGGKAPFSHVSMLPIAESFEDVDLGYANCLPDFIQTGSPLCV